MAPVRIVADKITPTLMVMRIKIASQFPGDGIGKFVGYKVTNNCTTIFARCCSDLFR